MKKITIIVVLCLLLFSFGCEQQKTTVVDKKVLSCSDLTKNFDANINTFPTMGECEKSSLWVGGMLVNISTKYAKSYDRYEHELMFKGGNVTEPIHIGSKNKSISYTVGKFYKFDLQKKCRLILSMASSGMYYDPNQTALQVMKCE